MLPKRDLFRINLRNFLLVWIRKGKERNSNLLLVLIELGNLIVLIHKNHKFSRKTWKTSMIPYSTLIATQIGSIIGRALKVAF
jgi:hypothetical protein